MFALFALLAVFDTARVQDQNHQPDDGEELGDELMMMYRTDKEHEE